MARKFVCDRCKAEFSNWATQSIEIPAASYFGKKDTFDLCSDCIVQLRKLVNSFMEKTL